MDKKTSEVVNNVCALLGGALLLYPLIDEATKTIIPEIQKLTSAETIDDVKLLTDGQGKDDKDDKSQENELAELKRKIAELESEKGEQKSDN